MTQEPIKLKPCPFCGKDPGYSKKFLAVLGKHMIECSDEDCAVVFFGTTFEDVAEKWNNRQTASSELMLRIDSVIEKLDSWASYHYNESEIVSDNNAAASCAFTQAIELLEESLKP